MSERAKLSEADLQWMQEWADEWAATDLPGMNETQMARLALSALAEIRESRRKLAKWEAIAERDHGKPIGAAIVRREIDEAIAAHDPADPNHRSHGGQHHNGPCCVLGAVTPGAIRALKDWRRLLGDVVPAPTLTPDEVEALRALRAAADAEIVDGLRDGYDCREAQLAVGALDKLLGGAR